MSPTIVICKILKFAIFNRSKNQLSISLWNFIWTERVAKAVGMQKQFFTKTYHNRINTHVVSSAGDLSSNVDRGQDAALDLFRF